MPLLVDIMQELGYQDMLHMYLFCSHLASMNNLQELLIQNQHCASLWESNDIDGLQIWFHNENLKSNQN
jgi:hypothetical protein